MARPSASDFWRSSSDQSALTYPAFRASALWPRWRSARPGPHKPNGVYRPFCSQVSLPPIDCQAISLPTSRRPLAIASLLSAATELVDYAGTTRAAW